MEDLEKHEKFEIEVLDLLKRTNILKRIVFVGGTMLRLCYGLDRYSVDLDFWLTKALDINSLYDSILEILGRNYNVTDSYNKYNSLLYEIKSPQYPKKLKLEIRKWIKKVKQEINIAYSVHSNLQVLLKTITLNEMMNAKIDALLSRKEIRDAYDIEFLIKKGIKFDIDNNIAKNILSILNGFKVTDYKIKLGSILPSEVRSYYAQRNFVILKDVLNRQIERPIVNP